METRNYFTWAVLFVSLILAGCSASKGLTREERIAQETALREAIEKRAFVVAVDKAFPVGEGMRVLTSPYSLTVNGNEVKSYLPFFGRAYSVPYGGGAGLIFDSTITDYQLLFDKKGKATIEFKTKSKDDQFVYNVSIFVNGSASVNVMSVNRQSISFTGKASPQEKN